MRTTSDPHKFQIQPVFMAEMHKDHTPINRHFSQRPLDIPAAHKVDSKLKREMQESCRTLLSRHPFRNQVLSTAVSHKEVSKPE
mmetsp:Transcript_22480/g.35179  ORF Transcript_22480/g.35179 Transcript_22480/m.35179 type:complete len:84 (+) Transcript_22480:257-508(+)